MIGTLLAALLASLLVLLLLVVGLAICVVLLGAVRIIQFWLRKP